MHLVELKAAGRPSAQNQPFGPPTRTTANHPFADFQRWCDRDRVNSTEKVASPLDTFVSPILGFAAWGVKQGHGSFLTFEFGEPKLEVVERQSDGKGLSRSAYVYGQWHLWIYCCHWRALQGGTQLASSEDENDLIYRAAAGLNGQKLLSVAVDPTQGRSTFSFDLGGSLETWPYGNEPAEKQWIIQTDTEAFAYRSDGLYSREPSNMTPKQQRWLPLLVNDS